MRVLLMMREHLAVCWALPSTAHVQPSTWCVAPPLRSVPSVAVAGWRVMIQQTIEQPSVEGYLNFNG